MAFIVTCLPARGRAHRTAATAATATATATATAITTAAVAAVGGLPRRGCGVLPRRRALPRRGGWRPPSAAPRLRRPSGSGAVVAVAADPPGHPAGGGLDAGGDGGGGGGLHGGGGVPASDEPPLSRRPSTAHITVQLGGVSLTLPGRVWLAAVPALWSTFIVSTKLLVTAPVALPPALFNAARLCLSATVCVPFIVREVRRGWKASAAGGCAAAAAAPGGGLDFLVPGVELGTWMFLANTAQMVGLRTTTASRAAFLVQLESVLVPLASAALGLTPLTATALVSSAVTVAGVAVLSSDCGGGAAAAAAAAGRGGRVAAAAVSLSVGDGLEVLAAVLLTAYVLRTSHHARRVRRAMPLVAVKIVTQAVLALGWAAVSRGVPALLAAARAAVSAAAAAAAGRWTPPTVASAVAAAMRGWVMPPGVTPGVVALNIGLVVWSGLFVSATTTWLQTAGQRVVPASEAAIIYATQPLWASLLAAVVLGESFGGRGVLGGLLILVGVVLAGRGRRPSVVAVEPGGDAGGGAATASTAPTLAP